MYPRDDSGLPQGERFQSLAGEYGISGREKEIILLICQGKTNKEIGKTLFISLPTVKDHVSNIIRKNRRQQPRAVGSPPSFQIRPLTFDFRWAKAF